jgi:hypothetical protein
VTVVRVPISDDQPDAYVEFDVDLDEDGGVEPLGARRGRPIVAASSLAGSLDATLPALSLMLAKLRAAAAGCDEVAMQLGLRVGGETGLVFVRGGGDATIGVTVTWRSRERRAADQATVARGDVQAAGAGSDDEQGGQGGEGGEVPVREATGGVVGAG